MTSEFCLSIDLGTGGPKIGLVDFDGTVLDYELHSVATTFADDGAATQDAQEWWDIIAGATRRLVDEHSLAPDQVTAVAVTGQYASTVPVDDAGLPTGPCLTWLDTRGSRFSKAAVGGPVQGYNPRKIMTFIKKTGGAPSVSNGDPICHILYLQEREPEQVARTRWFMEPVDYLTMRFTGVASATHASRLALWLTDNRHLTTYSYDRQLINMVGVDASRLPPLVPIGSVVGTVMPDVAARLGISPGAAVITGLPDLHAATLGSGGTGPFETHLALSTTSWISCPFPSKKTDLNHMIASIPGLTNDSYLVINGQETGGKALEWFRDVLAGSGQRLTYDEMTELAATSPPGANGVIFTPWLAGERSPVESKSLRAGFTNLSITTTSADMIRAVMEGVAANSAWLFGFVEKFVQRELSPIRLVGGGAQSRLWCQIFADALGREVLRVPDPMVAQLRGAALMASVSLGRVELSSIGSAQPVGESFVPDANVAIVYEQRRRQMASLYERDKSWGRRDRRRRASEPH